MDFNIILIFIAVFAFIIIFSQKDKMSLILDKLKPNANRLETPNLDKYSRDLIKLARENKLDPVVDRDEEIKRLIYILSRRTKNNPVLIGETGVGQTAIHEAVRLANKYIKYRFLPDKAIDLIDEACAKVSLEHSGNSQEKYFQVTASDIKKY